MKKNTDLRSVDGQTVYLPQERGGDVGAGNIALPNVYEQSATALYPIGTRFVVGDRTYHYAYAPAAIAYNVAALVSMSAVVESQASLDTSQAAGTTEFKIDGTGDGAPAKDAYAGGHIVIWRSDYTLGYSQMRVLKNTAGETDSPYTTTLTLEQGLPTVVAGNTGCDIFPNRYADVRTAFGSVNQGGHRPFVGMPTISVTALRYIWIQTWGPVFIVNTLTDDLGLGGTQFNRTAVFAGDGSIRPCDTEWNDGSSQQFAGYSLISNSTTGSSSGYIMLMLDR